MSDPTRRFTDRVSDYLKARPSYPSEIPRLLHDRCGLRPGWRLADIGSGPGNLCRLFLEYGNRVIGVEPNREMRLAGERALASVPGFTSVDGRAEATGLPAHSVELITAGQAFHWFDPQPTRVEFERILRPGGFVVIVWNDRFEQGSQFMRGYEELLRIHGTDYHDVHHRRIGVTRIARFYGSGVFDSMVLSYRQVLNREGLRARLRSSSYVPAVGSPGHAPLIAALEALFADHQSGGTVEFLYRTRLYWGQLQG